jgi:uncharacterized membrane protein
MKSPGVIYRRYRQLKRKLLYDKIVKARQICHGNCFYGKTLGHGSPLDPGFTWFNICMYNYDTNDKEFVLCTCPKECNAFSNKWTKEKVLKEFENEMNDWTIKQKFYPEVIALEWVLDKDLTEAIKNPNILNRIVVGIILFMEKALKYINKIHIKMKTDK